MLNHQVSVSTSVHGVNSCSYLVGLNKLVYVECFIRSGTWSALGKCYLQSRKAMGKARGEIRQKMKSFFRNIFNGLNWVLGF